MDKANTEEIRKALKQRLNDLKTFDKLTPEEQEARRKCGRDPYEPIKVRERKQAAERNRYRRWFNSLKPEERAMFIKLGWNPDRDENTVIRRECGTFKAI